MNSFYHQPATPKTLKDKSDYVHAVLVTELLADHLPRLPWFLRNLQCALEESSTELAKVCAALEMHPRICAEFMRIACLAEPAQPITASTDQLVILLGKRRVWTSVVAAYLVHELNSTWSNTAQKKAFSIGWGRSNKALANAYASNAPAPEQAYVSGILSIVGLLPLISLSGVTDQVPDWLGVSPQAMEKQREAFRTDFLELGRWACLLWRLPLESAYVEKVTDPSPDLFHSQLLPKEEYSPAVALSAASDSRSLILVSRGTRQYDPNLPL
jgi:hypothetical protein